MRNVYQNDKVKHSANCASVSCFFGETTPKHEHCAVFIFSTKKVNYHAETLFDAAKMWAKDGQHELHNVERFGQFFADATP